MGFVSPGRGFRDRDYPHPYRPIVMPGEVALVGSANAASLTLAGAGSANEQLAAPVRGKLATTEEGPSGSFRGALS
jgi:hypothetical protein